MKRLFALVFLCGFLITNAYGEIINYTDGSKYVGELRNGKRHGQGVYTDVSGYEYAGEWTDDERNGAGTAFLSDGRRYVGQWIDDEMNGLGTLTTVDGEYFGEWKNGLMHGHGTYTSVKLDEYAGAWKNGNPHGLGIYKWGDEGKKFFGEFRNGKRWEGIMYEGAFVLTKVLGSFTDGSWCKDCKPTKQHVSLVDEVKDEEYLIPKYPWIPITGGITGGTYISQSPWKKSGRYHYVYAMADYGHRVDDGVMSVSVYLQVDCGTSAFMTLQSYFYLQPMANGPSETKVSTEKKWKYPAPNRGWSNLIENFCLLARIHDS